MDQSMICLPSDVKTALEKTSFIKRYEDLDEIVESVFKLFEDFKKAMTAS